MHIYEDVTALSIVIMQLWCRSTSLHKRQFLNDDTRDEITGIHPRCSPDVAPASKRWGNARPALA